jgi:tetratricopeptide (TPR) repeat protein
MIPGRDEWTVIFSKDANNWGSFWYDEKDDALRVKTKAAKAEYHEWLTYEFTEREPAKATLALKWEELQVPISISVDNVNQLWIENMRTELRGSTGFNWQYWQQAANFCAQNNINLEEGLKWAQRAVSDPSWSGGQENFTTLATLSRLQALNGKPEEAAKTFDKALNHPSAQPVQIHMAARQLMTAGNKEQAIRVYQFNAKRFPNQWPVHVGLMRSYAAMGDKKKALAEGRLALAQAPDDANKKNLQGLVKQLEEGKDIN